MKIYKTQNNYYYKNINNKKIRISQKEFNKLQQQGAGVFDYFLSTSKKNEDNELTQMRKDVTDEIDKIDKTIKEEIKKIGDLKDKRYARTKRGNYIIPTKVLRDKINEEIRKSIFSIKLQNDKKSDLIFAISEINKEDEEINKEDEKKAIREVLNKYLGETIGQNISSIVGPKLGYPDLKKKRDKRKTPNSNGSKNSSNNRVSNRIRIV
jgi:hypothetical protein